MKVNGSDDQIRGDDPADRSFARHLRQLRERAGTPTVGAIARKANCSAGAVSNALNGKVVPSDKVGDAIVRVLGGEPDQAWRELLNEARSYRGRGVGAAAGAGSNGRVRPAADPPRGFHTARRGWPWRRVGVVALVVVPWVLLATFSGLYLFTSDDGCAAPASSRSSMAAADNRAAHAEFYRAQNCFEAFDDLGDGNGARLEVGIAGVTTVLVNKSGSTQHKPAFFYPPVPEGSAIRYRVCLQDKDGGVSHCGAWAQDVSGGLDR
ncbi:MAG: helix-turn-helix domain-containing protein [Pseudonocardiaceae bacterium]